MGSPSACDRVEMCQRYMTSENLIVLYVLSQVLSSRELKPTFARWFYIVSGLLFIHGAWLSITEPQHCFGATWTCQWLAAIFMRVYITFLGWRMKRARAGNMKDSSSSPVILCQVVKLERR